jgi:hypothetical protein
MRKTQRQLGTKNKIRNTFKPDISPAEHKEHMCSFVCICPQTHTDRQVCMK